MTSTLSVDLVRRCSIFVYSQVHSNECQPAVCAAIKAVGARLLFIPPYSPAFNPIEWGTQTFTAGLRCDSLSAPWVIDRAMKRVALKTYVETELAPTLNNTGHAHRLLSRTVVVRDYGDLKRATNYILPFVE